MADIRKGATEVLRVQATEFKGYPLVDIRCWYEVEENGAVVLRPTKKGACFSRELLPQVISALQVILGQENEEPGR